MEYLRKNDPVRKQQSFMKHVLLMMQPFIIALLTTVLWRWLWKSGIRFDPADESIIIGAVITTLGLAYSITATIVLSSVWEKYKKVMFCVLENDRRTFMLYRDERMPVMLHLFLGSLSLPLLVMIMMLGYKSLFSGIVSVFSISFFLSLYWVVLAQLEDPMRSAWFAERLPKEWLTDNVDTFFLKPKNKPIAGQPAEAR